MAKCPIQGCDYEGSSSSVEGHISSLTDDLHQGKLGSDYRARIEGTVGVESSGDSSDEPDAEGGINPGTALIGATAGFVLLAVLSSGGSGSADQQAPASPEEESHERDQFEARFE